MDPVFHVLILYVLQSLAEAEMSIKAATSIALAAMVLIAADPTGLITAALGDGPPSKRARTLWSSRANTDGHSFGMYERDVCGTWEERLNLAEERSDTNAGAWVDSQYRRYFRMDRQTFNRFFATYGHLFPGDDSTSRFRPVVGSRKRVCIVLNWLATGDTYATIGGRRK